MVRQLVKKEERMANMYEIKTCFDTLKIILFFTGFFALGCLFRYVFSK